MSLLKQKINSLLHSVSQSSELLKPIMVKLCRTEKDKENARLEFANSDGAYRRLIIISQKNMSIGTTTRYKK